MSVKNDSGDEINSEPQAISHAKKFGLAVVGFFICYFVAMLTRILTDFVLVRLGSSGGSHGASLILAILPAYFVYDGFSNNYTRMGGRVALAVLVGSIVVGLLIGLTI